MWRQYSADSNSNDTVGRVLTRRMIQLTTMMKMVMPKNKKIEILIIIGTQVLIILMLSLRLFCSYSRYGYALWLIVTIVASSMRSWKARATTGI